MKVHGWEIFLWDAIEEMDKLISKEIKVDVIICDPPYGTTQNKWDYVIPFDKMWERLDKLVKPNWAIVLFWSEPFSSSLRMSNIKNYKYDWIWDKVLKTWHLNSKIMPMWRYENIMVFWGKKWKINYYPIMEEWKPQHKSNRSINKKINSWNYWKQSVDFDQKDGNISKYPNNILVFQKIHPSKCIHPTQKPIELMEYLVKTYSKEWDLVLDFTFWIWTTLKACLNTWRKFIWIEKNERYFNLSTDLLSN